MPFIYLHFINPLQHCCIHMHVAAPTLIGRVHCGCACPKTSDNTEDLMFGLIAGQPLNWTTLFGTCHTGNTCTKPAILGNHFACVARMVFTLSQLFHSPPEGRNIIAFRGEAGLNNMLATTAQITWAIFDRDPVL
jgi:hypothetical protein